MRAPASPERRRPPGPPDPAPAQTVKIGADRAGRVIRRGAPRRRLCSLQGAPPPPRPCPAALACALLAAVVAAAAALAAPPDAPGAPPYSLLPPAHAAISATGVGYDTTTVVRFANSGPDTAEAFRLWLSGNATFKSFKAEKGWTGERLPQGVLVFRASPDSAVGPGQAVKFGIKSDVASPSVNWRALDGGGGEIGLSVTIATGPPSGIVLESRAAEAERIAEEERIEAARIAEEERIEAERQRLEEERRLLEEERKRQEELAARPPPVQDGVLPGSEFRLVPDAPHVGAHVRVVGQGFGAGQPLTLHLGGEQIAQFAADQSGRFVATAALPPSLPADRAEFAVRDGQGNERTYSVRIADVPGGARPGPGVGGGSAGPPPLVVLESPGATHPGGALSFSGTARPGASITITVADGSGEQVTARQTEAGPGGAWSYGLLMPIAAGVGNYTASITDGSTSEERSWMVADDSRVSLEAAKERFEPGETLRFSGRGEPSESLTAIIESPRGQEVYSETANVSSTGDFAFEMPTTVDSIEGTYTAFAFQGAHVATANVGLGEPPKPRLAVRAGSVNYQAGDLALFAVDGPPGATVTLSVLLDQSEKFASAGVLDALGRFEYPLDLFGYASGVYTVVASHATSQASTLFSVGLDEGSGRITVQTTRPKYLPGEQIVVFGGVEGKDKVLVTLSLIGPDGAAASSRDVIVDNAETYEVEGDTYVRLSVSTFRVPGDAAPGAWTLRAESGDNFAVAEFEVDEERDEGLTLVIEEFGHLATTGRDSLHFRVIGAANNPISVAVVGPGGEEVGEGLSLPGRSSNYPSLWWVPEGLERGVYTMVATAGKMSANATFSYPP